jgi:hypothetical protein
MSRRGPVTFKQRDVTRAINATKAADLSVARVEVDKDDKIVIVPGQPELAAPQNAYDAWVDKHANASEGH